MTLKRCVEALVKVIEKQTPWDSPLEPDTTGMHQDLAAMVSALGRHRGVNLGKWELGFLDEQHARKMMQGIPSELATKYEHYCSIGHENGEVWLNVGWSPADGNQYPHAVLEVDPEYAKIENKYWPSSWLAAVYKELPEDDPTRAAMRSVFTELAGATSDDLEVVEASLLKDKQARPEDADALTAGGHLYFATAPDGTTVSVHKKGVRFLDSKGKRKAKNGKSVVSYGDIAIEGDAALFLCSSGPLFRVALPDGKPTTAIAVEGVDGFAAVAGGRLVLRKDCEVALARIEGDQLEILDSVVSLDLGGWGVIRSLFAGRGFVVSNAPERRSWVFGVTGDELEVRFALPGNVGDFPHAGAHVADEGDSALIETEWPHSGVTRVPFAT